MSKKNKKALVPETEVSTAHTAEYRIIKHDLIRVLILNAIYLIAVLGVYFTDQKTHYLEKVFSRILHF